MTHDDIVSAMFDRPVTPAGPRRRSGILEKARRVGSGFGGVLLALGAVSAAGGAAVAVSGPSCTGHVVQTGDTLWGISQTLGVDVATLAELNGIADAGLIFPGQCIDGGPAAADSPIVYDVGDPNTPRGRTYYATPGGPYIANNFVADGPSPGAVALGDALQTVYPQFGRAIDPDYGIGIWNVRNARGARSMSTHASGLALDFYVVCGPDADAMLDKLVANVAQLGIERVVMCERTWRTDRGEYVPSDTLADLHNGHDAPAHAHIELTITAGAELTYAEAVAVLAAVPPTTIADVAAVVDPASLPSFGVVNGQAASTPGPIS